MLSQEDLAFVERRRRAVRSWRWVGVSLLVLLAGFAVGLYLKTPMLIVPGQAVSRAQAGELDPQTLLVMASLLPAAVLALFAVAAAVVGFGFAAFANERRLIKLLDEKCPTAPATDAPPAHDTNR